MYEQYEELIVQFKEIHKVQYTTYIINTVLDIAIIYKIFHKKKMYVSRCVKKKYEGLVPKNI